MKRIAVALGNDPYSRSATMTAQAVARLFHAGDVDAIIMSGKWSILRPQGFASTEARYMRLVARSMAVPESAIILEENSRDLITNLVEVVKLLRHLDIKQAKLVIVCNPYVRRRLWCLVAFIVPPCYRVEVQVTTYRSGGVWSRFHTFIKEWIGYSATHWSLRGLQTGDLAGLQSRLTCWHPGYRRSQEVPEPIQLV